MEKVLIITYYWPPGSGAGVQRWLKFSKFLPDYGWEPVILTIDPDYAVYPALDSSLEKDITSGIKVYRTKAYDWFRIYSRDKSKVPSAGFAQNKDDSFKGKIMRFVRGNFFIPDPRKGWNSFAFRKASSLILKEKISHVITTSPPHSTQLIGLKLKKKFPGIIWTADLRDPWTDIYYYDQFYPTVFSRFFDRSLEKRVLQSADRIITVGNSLKTLFSNIQPGIEEKIKVITNGFDEEDFANAESLKPDTFTISYIGTLSEAYPIEGFLKASGLFTEEYGRIIFRLVGKVSAGQKEKILNSGSSAEVEFIPYVSHHEAINFMMSSSLLLLIIPDHHSNKSILTGKLFEYIASGKPVLCLGPEDGDAAEIISSSVTGFTADYNDIESIKNYLIKVSNNTYKATPEAIQDYSRSTLTKKLADFLK